jgi:hypothetical protein
MMLNSILNQHLSFKNDSLVFVNVGADTLSGGLKSQRLDQFALHTLRTFHAI